MSSESERKCRNLYLSPVWERHHFSICCITGMMPNSCFWPIALQRGLIMAWMGFYEQIRVATRSGMIVFWWANRIWNSKLANQVIILLGSSSASSDDPLLCLCSTLSPFSCHYKLCTYGICAFKNRTIASWGEINLHFGCGTSRPWLVGRGVGGSVVYKPNYMCISTNNNPVERDKDEEELCQSHTPDRENWGRETQSFSESHRLCKFRRWWWWCWWWWCDDEDGDGNLESCFI